MEPGRVLLADLSGQRHEHLQGGTGWRGLNVIRGSVTISMSYAAQKIVKETMLRRSARSIFLPSDVWLSA
jgi:hypothetical protein